MTANFLAKAQIHLKGLQRIDRSTIEFPINNGNTPYSAGVAWAGLVNLDEDWQARGNFLLKQEFGANRESGFFPGGRAQISRKLTQSISLALDYFGGHSNITDLGDFDANEHQLGPLISVKILDGCDLKAGVLFGLSAASPNVSFRFDAAYQF